MATSEVSICNSALGKLGAQRILSLEDNNDRAKLLKEQYPKLRDELLYAHPWNFAIGRVTLAETVAVPEYDWEHQFQLPTDCLRVLDSDLNRPGEWAVEDGKFMSQFSTAKIKYIKQVTDVSKFTAGFCEVLAYKIAADICYSITQSVTLRDQMLKEYKASLTHTRTFNGQESLGDRVYADSWLNSRA